MAVVWAGVFDKYYLISHWVTGL